METAQKELEDENDLPRLAKLNVFFFFRDIFHINLPIIEPLITWNKQEG